MGFALGSCQGCQAAPCHPWGHWGTLGLPQHPPPRKQTLSCHGSAGWWPNPEQAELCGCSWGPEKLRRLLSSERALLGVEGAAGGSQDDWPLSPPSLVPTVPGLAGMLQRGKAGAAPGPGELLLQETAAVCPHLAPGLALSCAGHGALQRASRSSPGSQILGWVWVDAPGWCCSWLAASGIPDPALGSLGVGTAPEPGCEILWVPTQLSAHQGVPVERWPCPSPHPWPSSRAVAWKAAGVEPRPGAEQSLQQIFPVV